MPTIANSPLSFFSGLRNKVDKANPPPLPQFPNPDFDQNFDFWDVLLGWQTPGGVVSNTKANRVIAGHPIPSEADRFPESNAFGMIRKSPGQSAYFPNYGSMPIPNWTYQATIQPDGPEGNYALLTLKAGYVSAGGATTFGPALVSQSPVVANVGDRIRFNWTARGGGDAYKVLAYIINKDNGMYHIMLDETGASETATTPWATASKIIKQGEAGNYYFVFICGTFDWNFMGVAGAELGVDSIRRDKAGTY